MRKNRLEYYMMLCRRHGVKKTLRLLLQVIDGLRKQLAP